METRKETNQLETGALNAMQLEAAASPASGPVLVVAGPGTGKTRVIVERIKHLVNNNIKPSEILCLTFSEKATLEMQERLEKEIDTTNMQIKTYHSFTHEILDQTVLESGIGISGGIVSRISELVWAMNNIDSFGFKNIEIGNDPYRIIESMVDGISTFKNELVTPEELQKFLDNKFKDKKTIEDPEKLTTLNQLQDFQRMYAKVQKFLTENRLIDFDDMVMLVVELFKRKNEVLTKYQKKFKYVLVDEFQDTNFAQFELVRLLTPSGNITAVGDEDQSIYRFQGAYSSIFDNFRETYKGELKEVILEQNYRSPKNVIKLATQLLAKSPNRTKKTLTTENEDGSKITVARCAHDMAEVEWVRKKIQELLGTNLKRRDGTTSPLTPKDITILTRTKRDGKKFALTLNAHGISASFVGDAQLFTTSVGRDLIAYLEIASNSANAGTAINRILKSHGISDVNIARINRMARNEARKCSYSDYLYDIITKGKFADFDQGEEISEIGVMLSKLANLSHENSVGQTVHKIMMNLTDLYKKLTRDDSQETKKKRRILNELHHLANEFEIQNKRGKLSEFVQYLQLLGGFDVEIQEGFEIPDTVRVSTIHQSKGREFPVVFIADVAQRKFPGDYRAKKFYVPDELAKGFGVSAEKREFYLEEEKRLFYVAINRAQNYLFISYSKKYLEKSRLYSPSDFLAKDLDFENNPLIMIEDVDSEYTEPAVKNYGKNELLISEAQKLAIKNIDELQIKSAIKKLIDLGKIAHFEKNKNLDGFDHKDLLDVTPSVQIDSELKEEKIPLVDKESLRLSASQFRIYQNCPKMYKYSYVLNVPELSTTPQTLGDTIHKVFQNLSLKQMEGKTISKEIALELLEKYWDSAAYDSDSKENEDRRKAKMMIDNFFKWTATNTNKVVGVEVPFKFKLGGVMIRGMIDRIEKDPQGNYYVVDYKTGICYESDNSVAENVQMNVYAMAIESMFKKLPLKTTLFYVREDKLVHYHILNRQLIDDYRSKLENVVDDIINEKFEANPAKGFWTCKFCPFKSICDDAAVN